MPGDGITDVAPLTQQQWNGHYLTRSKLRPYGSQAVEGWIDLQRWWDVAAIEQIRSTVQSQPQKTLRTTQDAWIFTQVDADIQATVGAVHSLYLCTIPTLKSKGLPRQYLAQSVDIEAFFDPTLTSNIATRFPAVSAHMTQEPRRVSSSTVRESNPTIQVYALYEQPFTSFFAVVSGIIGKVNYTGGSLVLP